MTRYVVSPDTACAIVEDGAVLLHMRTKRYFSLNVTGAAIWQLLADEVPIAEIGAQLTERYDIERAAAHDAVVALLDDLLTESLVTLETP